MSESRAAAPRSRPRRPVAHAPVPHPAAPRGSWVPVPVCAPTCLPDVGPRVGAPRFALRLATLAVALGVTVACVGLLRGRARERWLRVCAAWSLRAAGVRLRVSGESFPERGALVVANHLSWVDVLALHACGSVRMQAKQEVADWPLLGGLARRTGALFVDRAGLRALPATVAETAAALRAGDVVAVFPEGTTWCGSAAGSFRRAAFQAAVDAGVPVRPVAIVLRLPDGRPGTVAAFVGDQTLWDSLRRILRLPGLVCELTLLPALEPGRLDRRGLAAAAAAAVGAITAVPHTVPAARRADPRSAPVAA